MKKQVKRVLFHQVALKTEIIINGEKFIKFSARKVMSEKGKLIEVPDATYVKLAA